MAGPSWEATWEWESEEDDSWRGDLHPDQSEAPGWREELAGPEYRMYRDQLEHDDDERDGDG